MSRIVTVLFICVCVPGIAVSLVASSDASTFNRASDLYAASSGGDGRMHEGEGGGARIKPVQHTEGGGVEIQEGSTGMRVAGTGAAGLLYGTGGPIGIISAQTIRETQDAARVRIEICLKREKRINAEDKGESRLRSRAEVIGSVLMSEPGVLRIGLTNRVIPDEEGFIPPTPGSNERRTPPFPRLSSLNTDHCDDCECWEFEIPLGKELVNALDEGEPLLLVKDQTERSRSALWRMAISF